jgi:hypothetical protein
MFIIEQPKRKKIKPRIKEVCKIIIDINIGTKTSDTKQAYLI